jgi:hypothetical protein
MEISSLLLPLLIALYTYEFQNSVEPNSVIATTFRRINELKGFTQAKNVWVCLCLDVEEEGGVGGSGAMVYNSCLA